MESFQTRTRRGRAPMAAEVMECAQRRQAASQRRVALYAQAMDEAAYLAAESGTQPEMSVATQGPGTDRGTSGEATGIGSDTTMLKQMLDATVQGTDRLLRQMRCAEQLHAQSVIADAELARLRQERLYPRRPDDDESDVIDVVAREVP